jgi:hypothetical protein
MGPSVAVLSLVLAGNRCFCGPLNTFRFFISVRNLIYSCLKGSEGFIGVTRKAENVTRSQKFS